MTHCTLYMSCCSLCEFMCLQKKRRLNHTNKVDMEKIYIQYIYVIYVLLDRALLSGDIFLAVLCFVLGFFLFCFLFFLVGGKLFLY